MLTVQEAESIILSLVQPLDEQLDTEVVEPSAATGRILAAPVTSQLDFPHWDNSAMDGYAVRYVDVQSCHTLLLENTDFSRPKNNREDGTKRGGQRHFLID